MTDKMFDEKGLRAGGETDPERRANRDEDAPDVEGHLRTAGPEEASEAGRMRLNEDEAEDEEGRRPT
jgi:hypothetical protein